jgi:hypothetical protein
MMDGSKRDGARLRRLNLRPMISGMVVIGSAFPLMEQQPRNNNPTARVLDLSAGRRFTVKAFIHSTAI